MNAMAAKHGRDPATIDIAYVVLSPTEWTAQPAPDGERRLMTGTVEQIADDVRSFKAIGVKHFNMSFGGSSLTEVTDNIQKFADDVMPLI